MRKRIKLIIGIILVILAVLFTIGVQMIKICRQTGIEKDQRKTIDDYQTGEILSWKKIMEKNTNNSVKYIIIELEDDKKLGDQYKQSYYILEEKKIKEIIRILEEEKFEVAEAWELDDSEICVYNMHFVMEEDALLVFGYQGKWRKDYCRMIPVIGSSNSVQENNFFKEYSEKNFLVSEGLSHFSENFILNEIKEITLAQAKKYISEGEQNQMVEKFCQHYYTTKGITDMLAAEVSEIDRFELADSRGYLLMERGVNLQEQGYYTVYRITLYNENEQQQEILYENKEAIKRKEGENNEMEGTDKNSNS